MTNLERKIEKIRDITAEINRTNKLERWQLVDVLDCIADIAEEIVKRENTK